MMWPYGYGPGWGAMVLGWLWTLVFVAAIAAIVVFLTRAAAPQRIDTPVDILRRRYAAGELTKEQFEQMKRELAA